MDNNVWSAIWRQILTNQWTLKRFSLAFLFVFLFIVTFYVFSLSFRTYYIYDSFSVCSFPTGSNTYTNTYNYLILVVLSLYIGYIEYMYKVSHSVVDNIIRLHSNAWVSKNRNFDTFQVTPPCIFNGRRDEKKEFPCNIFIEMANICRSQANKTSWITAITTTKQK